MADHAKAADFTLGSQGVNGAFEAVKEIGFTVMCNFD